MRVRGNGARSIRRRRSLRRGVSRWRRLRRPCGSTRRMNISTRPRELWHCGGDDLGPEERVRAARRRGVAHGMLAGWRGPYNLDALGNHDRAVQEFRHWLKRQNVTPVTTGDPAIGPMGPEYASCAQRGDAALEWGHLEQSLRHEHGVHGCAAAPPDVDGRSGVCARGVAGAAAASRMGAPALPPDVREASGKELPLYEAYAAIWASDNLQYNGGGAAHSSAYNVFAFRTAAKIANCSARMEARMTLRRS
jgi:hypothetical protein